MEASVNTVLLIANIVFFAAAVLFALFGVYELIMGPADAENLLKNTHFPLNYRQTLIVGFLCVALTIIIFIVREKLSGKM